MIPTRREWLAMARAVAAGGAPAGSRFSHSTAEYGDWIFSVTERVLESAPKRRKPKPAPVREPKGGA